MDGSGSPTELTDNCVTRNAMLSAEKIRRQNYEIEVLGAGDVIESEIKTNLERDFCIQT
jgi:hypothetical protein